MTQVKSRHCQSDNYVRHSCAWQRKTKCPKPHFASGTQYRRMQPLTCKAVVLPAGDTTVSGQSDSALDTFPCSRYYHKQSGVSAHHHQPIDSIKHTSNVGTNQALAQAGVRERLVNPHFTRTASTSCYTGGQGDGRAQQMLV
jgi:hypothetical protein